MHTSLVYSNLTCTNPRNVTANGSTTTYYDDCKVARRMTIPLAKIGTGYQTLSIKAHSLQVRFNVSLAPAILAPIILTGSNPDTSYLNYTWGTAAVVVLCVVVCMCPSQDTDRQPIW